MKKSLLTYNQYDRITEALTYEVWCGLLDGVESDTVSEGVKERLASVGSVALDAVLRLFRPIKDEILSIAKDFKVSVSDIVKAFKQRDIYKLLHALRFSVGTIMRAISEFNDLWIHGLRSLLTEISKNKYFQKIRSGLMTVDELLDMHPMLKKITGPAVAGLLLYVWLNSSFTGKMEIDMDLSSILAALRGNYSLSDLIASPDGLLMITLLATGSFLSAAWLSTSTSNLMLALIYTGYRRVEGRLPPGLAQLGSVVSFVK